MVDYKEKGGKKSGKKNQTRYLLVMSAIRFKLIVAVKYNHQEEKIDACLQVIVPNDPYQAHCTNHTEKYQKHFQEQSNLLLYKMVFRMQFFHTTVTLPFCYVKKATLEWFV